MTVSGFIDKLKEFSGLTDGKLLNELCVYLEEEYGITNEVQLSIASIDIKNDICDFANQKAA